MNARVLVMLLALLLAMVAGHNCGLPEDRARADGQRQRPRGHRQRKKDMYVSRGWGPGGMPFSVLYMNPTYATGGRAAPPPVAAPQKQHQDAAGPRSGGPRAPQARMAIANAHPPSHAKQQHSVVPQLFVSYNWAPMGKK